MVPPSAPPHVLASRYRLEHRLAQGGMAEVWLATDEALSRQVAVKILKPQLAGDAVAAERFRREARVVAGLTHPNIVAVYDAVEYDGQQAVVMQFVPGKSLREVLDADRKLSVEQTLRIGAAVASALDAAHLAGLVHRDVKPGNILITPDGRVLLTDFGIAKDAASGGEDLTSENVMMGTAKYLSPEQVRGRRLDGRADLYSLGLVLYECLAGRVPFQGESDADTALARLQRDPTPLGRMRPTLPAGLTALVHRLLAKDPDARPATGAQVCEAIDRVRLGAEEAPPRIEPPVPRRPYDHEHTTTEPARPRPPESSAPASRPAGVRSPTPPSGLVVRGHPNRKFQQRWTPSLVVIGGLLVAALVAGAFLWVGLRKDDPSATTAARSTSPRTTAPAGQATVATDPQVSTSFRVVSLASFDPRGDREENDDRLDRASDGDLTTSWLTECYQNQYFGSKQGVGVVVKLNGPAHGHLAVTMASAPWNVDVYVADAVPDDVPGWGVRVDHAASQSGLEATFQLDSDGQYVLLMLREAARDPQCSTANPFRSGLAEVAASR